MESPFPRHGVLALVSVLALPPACGSSETKRRPSLDERDGGADAGTGGASATDGGGGSGDDASLGAGGDATSGSGGVTASGGATASGGGVTATDGGPTQLLGPYVDCQNGAAQGDGGTGDRANPFKTIAQAIQNASPGETVFILDGRCDDTTQPSFGQINGVIDVPDGVSIRAVNPGQVTLVGMKSGYRASSLRFLGSGEIAGVRLQGFGNGIQVSTGTVHVKGVTFDDIYQGTPLILTGDANVIVEPAGVTNYVGAAQRTFASLADQAHLEMRGGTVAGTIASGISGDALFGLSGSSELVLDGFTARDVPMSAIGAAGASRVIVKNGSLLQGIGSAQAAVRVAGTATLEVLDSTLEGTNADGISCGTGTPSITVSRSSIVDSKGYAINAAVYSDCRPTVTLDAAKLNGNVGGLYLNYGGNVTITGSEINDSGGASCAQSGGGIYFNDPANAHQLRVRDTSIQRNCGNGLRLNGAAGSSFDLGRGSSPGNNIIAGNTRAGYSNLVIDADPYALTVYAVANTWDPGVQGAAPAGSTTPLPGRYQVLNGTTRDVSGSAQGANYTLRGGGVQSTILRLAETP